MKKNLTLIGLMLSGIICAFAQTNAPNKLFTESLMQGGCTFVTTGRNAYFILEVGYQQTFEN